MPQIVSIVGKSKSGKTALLERLIPEMRRRGYRVCAIKHIVGDFELDKPGKDSWRLFQAGSDSVLMSSSRMVALIRGVEHDPGLDELARLVGEDFDLVLTEGFKGGGAPKIEVHRGELGPELLCSPEELLAIATDEPLDLPTPQYPLDGIVGLADLIEERFVLKETERVSVFVNGLPLPINQFVGELILKTILGMVSSLKDVGEVRGVDISIRRAF